MSAQAETNLLRHLSPTGTNVLYAWATSNPSQVKAWLEDGSLLPKLKEAETKALEAEMQAEKDGATHLAKMEVWELYGGPTLNLRGWKPERPAKHAPPSSGMLFRGKHDIL
mgnify:FL=1